MNVSLQQLGIKGTEDWFFGNMTRDRANEILLKEEVGAYLIRASASQPGGFALSVRDKDRTNHYKIEASKRVAHDGYRFKIGNQEFYSMLSLIDNYKKTVLGDSTLTAPALKPIYRAMFDFVPSGDNTKEDLPLKRNDCVFYLSTLTDSEGREIPDWWRVQKRGTGDCGCVPAAYLTATSVCETEAHKLRVLRQLNFPFEVEVMRERNPNVFDSNQLKLEVGDFVEVVGANPQVPELWFGVVRHNQKQGLFPFNYVRPVPSRTTSSSSPPPPPPPARLSSRSFSGQSGGARMSEFNSSSLQQPPPLPPTATLPARPQADHVERL